MSAPLFMQQFSSCKVASMDSVFQKMWLCTNHHSPPECVPLWTTSRDCHPRSNPRPPSLISCWNSWLTTNLLCFLLTAAMIMAASSSSLQNDGLLRTFSHHENNNLSLINIYTKHQPHSSQSFIRTHACLHALNISRFDSASIYYKQWASKLSAGLDI